MLLLVATFRVQTEALLALLQLALVNGDTLSATLSLTALRRNLAKVRSTYLHFLLGGELIASYHPSPLHPPGVGMEQ